MIVPEGLVPEGAETRVEGGAAPRLMLVCRQRLSPYDVARIEETLKLREATGRPLIIDGGFAVFQCVDGEWREIEIKPAAPCAAVRTLPVLT